VYVFIAKLCTQQTEVILNHGNKNVRKIEQSEARRNKYKRLKLGAEEKTRRLVGNNRESVVESAQLKIRL
jgi:hypothetical protein